MSNVYWIAPTISPKMASLLSLCGVSRSFVSDRNIIADERTGFGFSDREYTIHQVRGIISFFRTQTPGGIYIVAGVPAHWRTSTMDAISDPEFVHVRTYISMFTRNSLNLSLQLWLNEVDVISPWSVGRYNDEAGADAFAEEKIKGDLEAIKKQNEENERNGSGKKLDYMPVVLPGGSVCSRVSSPLSRASVTLWQGYNLSEHKWPFNDIKRNGGRFFWRQIWNARRLVGLLCRLRVSGNI
jgi:hypothetical protein